MLFCQLQIGDSYSLLSSFRLVQCRYQIPSFCPYVTPASVGNQPPHRRSLSSIVRQPENGVYLAHLVNPQSLERIHQSRIIVRHCIESVSQYGERSRILHPFFPLEGAEGVILYFPFLYFSLLYFTLFEIACVFCVNGYIVYYISRANGYISCAASCFSFFKRLRLFNFLLCGCIVRFSVFLFRFHHQVGEFRQLSFSALSPPPIPSVCLPKSVFRFPDNCLCLVSL